MRNRTGILALAIFGVLVFPDDPRFGLSCFVAAGLGTLAAEALRL